MRDNVAIQRAFIARRVSEAVETYARADAVLAETRGRSGLLRMQLRLDFREDFFWGHVKSLGDDAWDAGVDFREVALSEWVSRAPGLYWEPRSQALRELVPAMTELIDDYWRAFRPLGKSSKVMGGIGTVRLPPAQDGYRLGTLTLGLNASTGVPALISPEVWEAHALEEGTIIQGRARWRRMSETWAARFPILRGLPRGYLVIDEPHQLVKPYRHWDGDRAPVKIHPFTIMEYHHGSSLLYDYVYATASTGEPHYRSKLEAFFDAYRRAEGRDGAYLLGADVSDPLWDARYPSPETLRSAERAGDANLRLLEARVEEYAQGKDTLEALIEALATIAQPTTLRTISESAGIPSGRWFSGGSVAEESARLVSQAHRDGKLGELIDELRLSSHHAFPFKPARASREERTAVNKKRLRKILAALYPRETNQRRIVAEVELPVAAIGFEAAADDTWFNILQRASSEQIDALLRQAIEEHPDDKELRQLAGGAVAPPQTAQPASAHETVAPSTLTYALDQQPWYFPLPDVEDVSPEELQQYRKTIDVLLVTATRIEQNAVLRRMQPLPATKSITRGTAGASTYYVGRFGEPRTALTMCRMGSIGTGASKDAVREGIQFWKPRAVIMVGIAFGRDPAKQAVADVLIASQIISYAEQRVGSSTHYRGPVAEASALLLDRFRNATHWSFRRPDGTPCETHEGPLLSGEEIIDNEARKKELFDAFPQAIGGEMEGRGLYGAAHDAKVDWILIKSICDWADGAKGEHHQPLAAAAAVDLAHHVLKAPGALSALRKAKKR